MFLLRNLEQRKKLKRKLSLSNKNMSDSERLKALDDVIKKLDEIEKNPKKDKDKMVLMDTADTSGYYGGSCVSAVFYTTSSGYRVSNNN